MVNLFAGKERNYVAKVIPGRTYLQYGGEQAGIGRDSLIFFVFNNTELNSDRILLERGGFDG